MHRHDCRAVGGGYHASTNNHISATSEDVSFAKLPYPVPFKTATEQHPHQQQNYDHHGTGAISLDSQLPVNVGGQAAFDFISSYDVPASGVIDNSLNSGAGAGAFDHQFDFSKSGAPASAVEALREILNRNIPYTDQELLKHQDSKAIDVQYSDQGGQGLQQPHDANTHFNYDATSSSSSSSSVPSFLGNFPPLNYHAHNSNFQGGNFNEPQPQQQQQTHTETSHTNININNSNPPVIQQYEIPPDPHTYVPAFKPLSASVGHYGPPAAPAAIVIPPGGGYGMPVRSVYQAHSIHTAYGPPGRYFRPPGTNQNHNHINNQHGPGPLLGNKHTIPNRPGNAYLPVAPPSPTGPHQNYGPPSATGPHQNYGPPPSFSSPGHYNRRTLIGSNKMHGKRSNVGYMARNRGLASPQPPSTVGVGGRLPGPVKSPELPPAPLSPTQQPPSQPQESSSSSLSSPIVVADHQPEHEYQVQQLKDDFGPDIEIQKSIQYELDSKGNPKEVIEQPIRRNFNVEEQQTGEQFKPSSSAVSSPLATTVNTGPTYSRPYSKRQLTRPKKYTFHRY